MSQKWTVGKIVGLFVGVVIGSLAVRLLLQPFKQQPYPIDKYKRQDVQSVQNFQNVQSALGQAVSNIRPVTDDSDNRR
jgi:uncharacterized membrane-anchored protein YhcB (DUF1043 family)